MRARSIIVPMLLVAAVACTGPTDPPGREAGPIDPVLHDVLVLGTRDGTVIVGSSSGAVLSSGGSQLAAPDGSRLYATTRSDGSTTLETRDSSTGAVLSSTRIRGSLDARAASLTGAPSRSWLPSRSVSMRRPPFRARTPGSSWPTPRVRSRRAGTG